MTLVPPADNPYRGPDRASDHRIAPSIPESGSDPSESHVYDRVFWLTYLSNCLTTLANGMMVRYSDFVDVLGGDEQQLGLIVGAGMVGSIVIRLAQGEAVDRYGASRVWFWSAMI